MSRSGYCESDSSEDNWRMICWSGAVASAIRGKRGQAMLKETLAALDAMPEKILAAESLINAEGQYCTLGALGASRGIDMSTIDPDDYDAVANAFGVAGALAREIMWLNDDYIGINKWVEVEICGPLRPYGDRRIKSICVPNENAPKERWQFMRDWVAKKIKCDNTQGEEQ